MIGLDVDFDTGRKFVKVEKEIKVENGNGLTNEKTTN